MSRPERAPASPRERLAKILDNKVGAFLPASQLANLLDAVLAAQAGAQTIFPWTDLWPSDPKNPDCSVVRKAGLLALDNYVHDLRAQLAAASERERALREYTTHTGLCDLFDGSGPVCTCGLSALLAPAADRSGA